MTDDRAPVTWHIDAHKISRYLTDLAHPVGGPKAKYLMRFGFTPAEPAILANALVLHATGNLSGSPPRRASACWPSCSRERCWHLMAGTRPCARSGNRGISGPCARCTS
ncbi:DUF6883 domain-containing protein [Methylobacterium sp. DCY52]|uniref:DUF6883 domain-containing protein n=1 Tax=Methylobacterium sp. DCY52 TaxID=739139 RepID=UPI00406BFAB4